MIKNTFEIGYTKWRACGKGSKWNVRDEAGALLLETQCGYADAKMPAKDAERIATIAAAAPELLAALKSARGCVKYYDDHEGAPIALQEVDRAIARAEALPSVPGSR